MNPTEEPGYDYFDLRKGGAMWQPAPTEYKPGDEYWRASAKTWGLVYEDGNLAETWTHLLYGWLYRRKIEYPPYT